MKKILTLGFILVLMLTISISVSAASWKGYGGISYNTYNLKDVNDSVSNIGISKEESGIGFFSGIHKWISSDLAIGGELEHLKVEWDMPSSDKYKAFTTGFLGTVTKKINNNLSTYGALGIYSTELEGSYNSRDFSYNDTGFGFKIGAQGIISINEKINLTSRLGYRSANVNVEIKDVDFSGFTFATALNIKF